jgi:hypothetical protein
MLSSSPGIPPWSSRTALVRDFVTETIARQRVAAWVDEYNRTRRHSSIGTLVDAAAWWLSGPNGGEEFAYALLSASCAAEVTTEQVYLALISPSDDPDNDGKVGTS